MMILLDNERLHNTLSYITVCKKNLNNDTKNININKECNSLTSWHKISLTCHPSTLNAINTQKWRRYFSFISDIFIFNFRLVPSMVPWVSIMIITWCTHLLTKNRWSNGTHLDKNTWKFCLSVTFKVVERIWMLNFYILELDVRR